MFDITSLPTRISVSFYTVKIGMNIPTKKKDQVYRGITDDIPHCEAKVGDTVMCINGVYFVKIDTTDDWYEANMDTKFVELNKAIFEKRDI